MRPVTIKLKTKTSEDYRLAILKLLSVCAGIQLLCKYKNIGEIMRASFLSVGKTDYKEKKKAKINCVKLAWNQRYQY